MFSVKISNQRFQYFNLSTVPIKRVGLKDSVLSKDICKEYRVFGKRGANTATIAPNTLYVFTIINNGWLVVIYVPSTTRSFRDGTPIYCPLRRT